MPPDFELRPDTGLFLPRGLGVLRFGAAERAAQWLVASLADIRPEPVCLGRGSGLTWGFHADHEGLRLWAGGAADGLRELTLGRLDERPTAPAGLAVAWRGVDLLGHPADEITAALGPAFAAEPRLSARRPPGADWFTVLGLRTDRPRAGQSPSSSEAMSASP